MRSLSSEPLALPEPPPSSHLHLVQRLLLHATVACPGLEEACMADALLLTCSCFICNCLVCFPTTQRLWREVPKVAPSSHDPFRTKSPGTS